MGDFLQVMRDDWNRRAREDAYYYVAFASPDQEESRFQTSAAEIVRELEAELHRLDSLGAGARRRALDIGCGPGRLVLPMSRHFEEIYGVDISEEMIRIARERLQSVPNARFLVNSGADLALFEDNYFSFVYSYIVFQHIPDKEIVLNYLREIQRVVAPGGVARFQLRGAPPSAANAGDSMTWNGCVIPDTEVVDFARNAGMELVGLTGEQTQYLWVTLRKRSASQVRQPTLEAVTSTTNNSTSIPQRGPGAAVSLWIGNAPDGTDLTALNARINGTLVRGSYLSPITSNGGCQMNCTLPRNLPIGPVEVALIHNGEVAGAPRTIIVEPAMLVPRVISVCDAKDIAVEMRSESGGVKVLIEDLEDPATIGFQLADCVVTEVDITCTNRILNQYLFCFLVPHRVADGPQTLGVYCEGRILYEARLEIHRAPVTLRPVLDAVTSASGNATRVPQRSGISLWISRAPADAFLDTLSARINGEPVPGVYLSPISHEGGCQMNVMLPQGLPIGPVEVALLYRGEATGPARTIMIEPALLAPRVRTISDAMNPSMEMRTGSGALKVLIEDVEDAAAIEFHVAGRRVENVEYTSTSKHLLQYLFSFRLPRETEPGPRNLIVRCDGQVVHEAEFEVIRLRSARYSGTL